jgi:hypothetical protein
MKGKERLGLRLCTASGDVRVKSGGFCEGLSPPSDFGYHHVGTPTHTTPGPTRSSKRAFPPPHTIFVL